MVNNCPLQGWIWREKEGRYSASANEAKAVKSSTVWQ